MENFANMGNFFDHADELGQVVLFSEVLAGGLLTAEIFSFQMCLSCFPNVSNRKTDYSIFQILRKSKREAIAVWQRS